MNYTKIISSCCSLVSAPLNVAAPLHKRRSATLLQPGALRCYCFFFHLFCRVPRLPPWRCGGTLHLSVQRLLGKWGNRFLMDLRGCRSADANKKLHNNMLSVKELADRVWNCTDVEMIVTAASRDYRHGGVGGRCTYRCSVS